MTELAKYYVKRRIRKGEALRIAFRPDNVLHSRNRDRDRSSGNHGREERCTGYRFGLNTGSA